MGHLHRNKLLFMAKAAAAVLEAGGTPEEAKEAKVAATACNAPEAPRAAPKRKRAKKKKARRRGA